MKLRTILGMSATVLVALTFVAPRLLDAAEAVRSHTVVIEEMKFTPVEIRIHPGDRVVFQNKDLVPHTASAQDPRTFDSGLIKAGEAWTLQLAGGAQTIHYACQYHPTMKGRIIVEQR